MPATTPMNVQVEQLFVDRGMDGVYHVSGAAFSIMHYFAFFGRGASFSNIRDTVLKLIERISNW